jgi:thymidylate synthase (FAD)
MQVDLIQSMGSDEMVARSAWVSTQGADARTKNADKIQGLINYLMRERHGTPFESNAFTFFIRAPLFVVREFQRHRIASYNEESGRYTQLKPEFYVPHATRKLVQKGKPGAYTFDFGSSDQHDTVAASTRLVSQYAYDAYETMLDAGVAKEVARMILPLNIYSSFYCTMNARALMNFLSLRIEDENSSYVSHPQIEIQQVAEQMEEIFKKFMPITWNAWNNNGRVAP